MIKRTYQATDALARSLVSNSRDGREFLARGVAVNALVCTKYMDECLLKLAALCKSLIPRLKLIPITPKRCKIVDPKDSLSGFAATESFVCPRVPRISPYRPPPVRLLMLPLIPFPNVSKAQMHPRTPPPWLQKHGISIGKEATRRRLWSLLNNISTP